MIENFGCKIWVHSQLCAEFFVSQRRRKFLVTLTAPKVTVSTVAAATGSSKIEAEFGSATTIGCSGSTSSKLFKAQLFANRIDFTNFGIYTNLQTCH